MRSRSFEVSGHFPPLRLLELFFPFPVDLVWPNLPPQSSPLRQSTLDANTPFPNVPVMNFHRSPFNRKFFLFLFSLNSQQQGFFNPVLVQLPSFSVKIWPAHPFSPVSVFLPAVKRPPFAEPLKPFPLSHCSRNPLFVKRVPFLPYSFPLSVDLGLSGQAGRCWDFAFFFLPFLFVSRFSLPNQPFPPPCWEKFDFPPHWTYRFENTSPFQIFSMLPQPAHLRYPPSPTPS